MANKFRIESKQGLDKTTAEIYTSELYTTIDAFLLQILDKPGSRYMLHDSKYKGSALDFMDKHGFISFQAPGSNASIIDITHIGLQVLKNGGVANYLKEQEERQRTQDNINHLTLQKLKFEQIPAKWWFIIILVQIILTSIISYLIAVATK